MYMYMYPTRSRAAYPPPRLAVNLFIFCCWHLGSLDFASWRLDLGAFGPSADTIQRAAELRTRHRA